MSLTHSVSIAYNFLRSITSGGRAYQDKAAVAGSADFASGTGAQAVNAVYSTGQKTLGGSADSYDLAGALVDGTATAFAITKLMSFCFVTPATNVGTVTVGGGSNPFVGAWGTTLKLPPGTKVAGQCVVAAGWTVTASTGDLVQVAGTSGDVYEMHLAGQ